MESKKAELLVDFEHNCQLYYNFNNIEARGQPPAVTNDENESYDLFLDPNNKFKGEQLMFV